MYLFSVSSLFLADCRRTFLSLSPSLMTVRATKVWRKWWLLLPNYQSFSVCGIPRWYVQCCIAMLVTKVRDLSRFSWVFEGFFLLFLRLKNMGISFLNKICKNSIFICLPFLWGPQIFEWSECDWYASINMIYSGQNSRTIFHNSSNYGHIVDLCTSFHILILNVKNTLENSKSKMIGIDEWMRRVCVAPP